MIKKFKTIQKIKRLKKSEINNEFLFSFKNELKNFMAANPVMKAEKERLSILEELNSTFNNYFYKIKNTKLMPIAIVVALVTMLTGGGAALASQNSVPGESLYPVKVLTENVRSIMTINNQSEAKLQSKLAAERLEEVSKMLQADEVDSEGVEIALNKLKEHVAKMSQIVEAEKAKGKDVSSLENDLSKNLNTNKEVLERTFKAQKEEFEGEKKSIERAIEAAEKGNADENAINELKTKLDALKQKKEILEAREHSVKREIEDEYEDEDEDENDEDEDDDRHEKSYNSLEWKLKALKEMREAEKEKNELLRKASSSNVVIAESFFKQYNDFMAKASSSLALGDGSATSTATSTDLSIANYKQAYQFAEQAEKMLKLAENELERQVEVKAYKADDKKKVEKKEEKKRDDHDKNEDDDEDDGDDNEEEDDEDSDNDEDEEDDDDDDDRR